MTGIVRRREHHLLRTHIKTQIMQRKRRCWQDDMQQQIPEAQALIKLNKQRRFWAIALPLGGTLLVSIPLFFLPAFPAQALLWIVLWILSAILYLDCSWFVQGFSCIRRWPGPGTAMILALICLPAHLLSTPFISAYAHQQPWGVFLLLAVLAEILFPYQRKDYYQRWFFRAARIYFRSYQPRGL